MAAPRLPFLYPNLIRAVRSCDPSHRSIHRSLRFPSNGFRTTSCRREGEAYHRRYGPAAEANLPPPSRPKDESGQPVSETPDCSKPATPPDQSQSQSQEQSQSQSQSQSQPQSDDTKSSAPNTSDTEEQTHAQEESSAELEPQEDDTTFTAADTVPDASPDTPPNYKENPLEYVLHMPSPSRELMPSQASTTSDAPPHLKPAPYVHHFDTYSLVRDLSKGGFTDDQSITIMKAVRGRLHNNIDLAKDSLISKSDVENESYLFQAACSELQSSLQTSRTSEMQTQRASRTQLQHETDILSQRLNQELAGLKDDIKGMFNDHKMTTREQQRSIDTSVQELNYKITVSLNSDGKSEIEGLRWILTRRAAFAIAISAGMLPSVQRTINL